MLLKAKFRVDFKATQLRGKSIKMSEDLVLPFQTNETYMHSSSVVYRAARKELSNILDAIVDIKHIYMLTEFEEIDK